MRIAVSVVLGAAACTAAFAAAEKVPSADVALRELKAGNDHHVADGSRRAQGI